LFATAVGKFAVAAGASKGFEHINRRHKVFFWMLSGSEKFRAAPTPQETLIFFIFPKGGNLYAFANISRFGICSRPYGRGRKRRR
jgi:hypothetical protein